VAFALGAALAPRIGAAAAPDAGPATDLDVTLDPEGRRIAGHARLRIVNDGAEPMSEVDLWLYPNVLGERGSGLNDVSFHWLYPGGFSPGAIEVSNLRIDGAPAAVTVHDVDFVGPRALATAPLAAPIAPGGAVSVDVDFVTQIPQRYGAFGCDGLRCRLMGGFYPTPTPARAGQAGPVFTRRPQAPMIARAGRTLVSLRLPPGLALVLDGQPIVNDTGTAVIAADDARYPTIVTDEVLRPATVTAGSHVVRYLHRRPRPPPSNDQPMPYVREDIAGLVLETARQALALTDAAGFPHDVPLTLVEAPLRHELVQQHGDVILVSDQIFRVFPFDRLRKYHRLEIARAVFAILADAAIRAHESPIDRDRAAGVLAAYLTDVYTRSEFRYVEYFRELLSPVDFVPAVDQLLYAPLLASPSTYFGDVDDRDEIRDGVARFADLRPGPRLLYNKLLDLVGPARFPALARKLYADHTPLRRAAAEVFGANLDWFWSQWLGSMPAVNYRLESVRVDGARVAIDVRREGEAIREPVEVMVVDRGGGARTLVWDDAAPSHTFDVDLPAGLASVEIDPRHRLVETAVGSLPAEDDARMDNRSPPRWRLLYEGAGALFNISQTSLNFAIGLLAKPQHDLRRQIEITAFHNETSQIGVGVTGGRSFGGQADKNRLASLVTAGLTGARLDPSFGESLGEAPQNGWRVSGRLGWDHDTRDYFFDPWRAVGWSATIGYTLTALSQGDRLSQVSAGASLLRLFEIAPGHVFAIAGESSATFGDVQLFAQLPTAGGPLALRGYGTDELLARSRAIGRIELRDDYFTGLDWNLLHFTTVRGFAGTVFADVAAIGTCETYGFARDRVYFDAGYSFRVLHDAFGLHQQLLSIDIAVPLNRHDPYDKCLGVTRAPTSRPPVAVLVSFFPSF
jgi:hypothetical protein